MKRWPAKIVTTYEELVKSKTFRLGYLVDEENRLSGRQGVYVLLHPKTREILHVGCTVDSRDGFNPSQGLSNRLYRLLTDKSALPISVRDRLEYDQLGISNLLVKTVEVTGMQIRLNTRIYIREKMKS